MHKTSSIISTIKINELIYITLLDETRHYFGGYYHVKILAFCDLPLAENYFDGNEEFLDAASRMGASVRFERILEKMAVPENEIVSVRSRLVDTFHETTLPYICTPDFPARFVRGAYLKCRTKSAGRQFSGV